MGKRKVPIPDDGDAFWQGVNELDELRLRADIPLAGRVVGPFGSPKAEIAIVGPWPGKADVTQPFQGKNGEALVRWLKEAGIDSAAVYWTYLVDREQGSGNKPSTMEVRIGAIRLAGELLKLKSLKAVVLVGSEPAALVVRGAMAHKHGKTGELFGRWPAIAMYDPWHWVNQEHYGTKQRLAGECTLILARAKHLGEPVELPEVVYTEGPIRVEGFLGLDTETHDRPDLRERMGIDRPPDPRAADLAMVTLSDGRLSREKPIIDPDAEPVAHNMPFDAVVVGDWRPKWHDSKMLAHLMNYRDTEMKSLRLRLTGRAGLSFAEAEGSENFDAYAVDDAIGHKAIFDTLWGQAPEGIKYLYENIERPLLRLWARYTMEGVFRLDREAANKQWRDLELERETLGKKICKTLNIDNPGSFAQIQRALGVDSSAVAVLRNMTEVPGVLDILRYRTCAKRVSTYLAPWLSWPFPLLGTLWRPTGAWTGRPSSARQNLQNPPHELDHLLLPPEGTVLYAPDYSTLEVRIAAHLSKDPNMIKVLREGRDIHNWAMTELHLDDRRLAKVGVFATLYGGSEMAIIEQAARFDIPRHVIKPLVPHLQEGLRHLFPGYFAWAEKVGRFDRLPGLFGRMHEPPASLSDPERRKRMLVNAPVQGGGVDVLKLSLDALDRTPGLIERTRHQMHDAAFIAVPEAEAGPDVEHAIAEVMENIVELDVPLKVEVKRWGEG